MNKEKINENVIKALLISGLSIIAINVSAQERKHEITTIQQAFERIQELMKQNKFPVSYDDCITLGEYAVSESKDEFYLDLDSKNCKEPPRSLGDIDKLWVNKNGVVNIIGFISLNFENPQPAPVNEKQAIQRVSDIITNEKKLTGLPLECVTFATTEENDFYSISLYEIHNERCGGDPNTSPIITSVSVDKQTGNIYGESYYGGLEIK